MTDVTLSNCGYNTKLRPLASKLRKNMTKAEVCLWKYVLKEKALRGYQFRRQRPVLQYIADFLCKDLALIIEIDGVTHDSEEAASRDEKREADLKRAGFEIVRFTDNEILKNLSGVRDQLALLIEKIETSTPCPRRRGTSRNDSGPLARNRK